MVQLNLNFTHTCWYTHIAIRLTRVEVQNSACITLFGMQLRIACALSPVTQHGKPEMHYTHTCMSRAHSLFDALNVQRYTYTLHYARNCTSQV